MAWTLTEDLDEYAAAFAAAWGERTGASAKVFRRSRLFSLGELELPAPCPRGTARVAVAADRDLLESWFAAFVDEVGDLAGRIPGAVDDRLSYGGLTLWDADRSTVSLAGVTPAAARAIRVASVYTPPQQRRLCSAGAVTASVSQ